MGILQDRLVLGDGPARLKSKGSAVSEVIGRLEAGETPGGLIKAEGYTPADLIAALAQSALGEADSTGPPLAHGKPPHPRLVKALSEPAWVGVFPSVASRARLTLAAGLLQVHDFWDASHDAAQKADDLGERDYSAYWHGIAHRREPDASNASYWFRRVGGRHPIFTPLAEAARPWLDDHGDATLSGRLISGGNWNASAMVELCTEARPGTPHETLARRLQRLEMSLLLEATFASMATTSKS